MRSLTLTDEQLQMTLSTVREARNEKDDVVKALSRKHNRKPWEELELIGSRTESTVLTSVMKAIYDAIDGD